MTYNEMMALWNRRPKNAPHRVLFRGRARCVLDDNADFIISRPGWEKRDQPDADGRTWFQVYRPCATLTKDNHLTLTVEPTTSENALKFLWDDLTGFTTTWTPQAYRGHKHKQRCFLGYRTWRGPSIPFSKGLSINVLTREILHHSPDVKPKVLRSASKDIYKFVARCEALAQVIARLEVSSVKEGYKRFNWNEPYWVSNLPPESFAMTDDNLATLATGMLAEGWRRSSYVPDETSRWAGGKLVTTAFNADEVLHKKITISLERGKVYLRKRLQELNGAVAYVNV